VIREAPPPHQLDVETAKAIEPLPDRDALRAAAQAERERHVRITAIVRANHDFIWRLLRRLGLPEASADDATQQVFCIASRRVDDIAQGSERSFLFGTAVRVASDQRRSAKHRERPDDQVVERADLGPSPEDLADQRRARVVLDEVLGEMSIEMRTILVLFELEQMTKGEVAELLGIPQGTAASRLRKAREEFKACVRRRLARDAFAKRRP
jgi:RNA polymerase sigma-70 factor (ECF subfamily)